MDIRAGHHCAEPLHQYLGIHSSARASVMFYNTKDLPDATIKLEGVNPNCGDDIFLNLKLEDGIIQDASFCGDGCAISQASADIMIGMIVGKTKEEALHLSDLFLKMIKGTATEEEVDELEEASALEE